jgi:ribose-phosphate pyrophosphokinase
VRLFALKGTQSLGRAIAAEIGCEIDPLEERDFPEGEHKSRPLLSVRNEDVYVVHSLYGHDGQSPDDRLLRLLFFIATCRDNGAARVTAIVPYLAFMRKEVQTRPRDPITTRYVAALFEAVGTAMVVGLEVHNKAAFQNAFRCLTTHLDADHLLVPEVDKLAGGDKVVFVSPDTGGMKRAALMQAAFEAAQGRSAGMAMMEKHRSEGVVTGEMFAGEVAGAAVFIVDDMIATGGTLVRAAQACRQHGAARVYALATHALVEHWTDEFVTSRAIDRIVVTDSVGSLAKLPPAIAGRVKVVSCAGLLGDAIKRLHAGGSIHRLLNPLP